MWIVKKGWLFSFGGNYIPSNLGKFDFAKEGGNLDSEGFRWGKKPQHFVKAPPNTKKRNVPEKGKYKPPSRKGSGKQP